MAAQRIAWAAMPDQVTVIGGSGALGTGLALRLAAAGVPVVIGSRDEGRAHEAAQRIADQVRDAQVQGLANGPAAEASEIVFLCVPFRNHSETLTNLKNHLRDGQLLVDTTVPLAAAISGKATRMIGVWQGSAAQQAQEMVPDGVTVVGALHTVSAPTLAEIEAEMDEDILLCGDSKADKARVAELVELIPGFRAVNAGALEMARIVEQLTPLLISINARYKTRAGIRITGLPESGHWER
jgi:8-hydroxy-5-deazaflavin:NADPH oxidoreductase